MNKQLITIITTVFAFLKTNVWDEEVLAIHLEDTCRTAAKVVAVVITLGIMTREQVKRFERFIEPSTPDFSIQ